MLPIFFNRKGDKVIKPGKEIVKKRSSVYGIYLNKGRLLTVIPTWSDLWDLPGGAIEEGETDLMALTREFKEETGYLLKKFDNLPVRTVKSNFYSDDDGIFYDSTMIFYKVTSIDLNNKSEIDNNEIKKVFWIPIDKIIRSNTKSFIYDVIQKTINIL